MKSLTEFITPTKDVVVESTMEQHPTIVNETVGTVFNTLFSNKIDHLSNEIKNCTTKEEVQNIAIALIEHIEKIQKEIQLDIKNNTLTLQEKTNLLQKKLSEISVIKEEEERKNKAFIYDSVIRQEEKANQVLAQATDIAFNKVVELEEDLKQDVDSRLVEFTNLYNKELKEFKQQTAKREKEVQSLDESLKNFITESKKYLSDEKYIAITNKIKQLENILENFNEKTILVENILSAPPSTETSDPLTPLDQNFVTHEQLVKHYQLFINRIQQQLTTLGGGGAAWLKDLQDVSHESIRTASDGQVLAYNAANAQWEATTTSGGGGGVTSVAGATGVVSNIQLSLGIAASGILTTANVLEDTNLYFSNTRVYDNVIQLGYITSTSLNTSNVAEGSNLYFTAARTIGALTGNAVSIGDLTVTGKSSLFKVMESFTGIVDATGVVTHNCSNTHIFNHTSIDNNFTANFTNLSLNSGEATSLTLVLNQGPTAYIANAVQIGGVAQTIKWQANAQPTGNVNAVDIQTFSVLNTSGTYIVLGQLTTFG